MADFRRPLCGFEVPSADFRPNLMDLGCIWVALLGPCGALTPLLFLHSSRPSLDPAPFPVQFPPETWLEFSQATSSVHREAGAIEHSADLGAMSS